jgi:Icc-related predicted phosphoesterase
VIRVAAVGDVHVGLDDAGTLAPVFAELPICADVLVLAGDLTRHGDPAEAAVLAGELADVGVPVLAVLGNHDHHMDRGDEVAAALERGADVRVLEGATAVLDLANVHDPRDAHDGLRGAGSRIAIVGAKGFGGGFAGACGTEFGEPEMKAFIRHTRERAEVLERELARAHASGADATLVVLHYSPARDTCLGEPLEIFPFLGSYLLGEAIDRQGADLVVHGHAHHGSERATTPGGVPVRNVARPLIGTAWRLFELGGHADAGAEVAPREADVVGGRSAAQAATAS